jgi:uncharacterized membrane protein
MFGIPAHQLIVHFPIVLTIAALTYDLRAVYSRTPKLHDIGYRLSLGAAFSAVAAVATGLSRAGALGLDSGAATGHTGYGIVSGLALATFGAWRYSALARGERDVRYYPAAWMALQIAAFLLICASAITGHRLY